MSAIAKIALITAKIIASLEFISLLPNAVQRQNFTLEEVNLEKQEEATETITQKLKT